MTVLTEAGEEITSAVLLLLMAIALVGVASYWLGYHRGARNIPAGKPLPEPEIEATAPAEPLQVRETAALFLDQNATTDEIIIPGRRRNR